MHCSDATLKRQCDAVVDGLDAGSANPNPQLILRDAESNILASIDLDGTAAFGTATSADPSVATATGLPIAFTGSGAGTAATFTAVDKDGVEQWSGDCGVAGSGADCELDNLVIAVEQDGNVTACVVRAVNPT
jgi:hypothetical protein